MVYSRWKLNIVFHHKKEVEQMDEIRLQPEPVNEVLLRGTLLKAPEFSHENHGKRFDRFTLSVQRLSGTYDHLEILADQSLTEQLACWRDRCWRCGGKSDPLTTIPDREDGW